MHGVTSGRLACASSVVVLIAALTTIGQPSVKAETLTVPRDGYGFSVGAPMTLMSDVDADRELDAAAKAGATSLRVLIDWHVVEPMPGAFNWGYVDHWINGSRARGFNVLGLIAYTPDWVRAPGSYFSAPPRQPGREIHRITEGCLSRDQGGSANRHRDRRRPQPSIRT
ncbi:MAG TPA: hypothetical protein VE666_09780 [Mycobacterium sp.]|jgi:hypothetical protein|nr:hypothetical protein [Mycobacterium sp.]